MLQSMGLQRVRHHLVTEKQQIYIQSFVSLTWCHFCFPDWPLAVPMWGHLETDRRQESLPLPVRETFAETTPMKQEANRKEEALSSAPTFLPYSNIFYWLSLAGSQMAREKCALQSQPRITKQSRKGGFGAER